MQARNWSNYFLYWIFTHLTDGRHILEIDSNIFNFLVTGFGVSQ